MQSASREILKFGHATTIAAAIIGASGALGVGGQPLLTVFDEILLNVATAKSEARKLREQAATPLVLPQHIPRLAR
jgi:hypothetical protein